MAEEELQDTILINAQGPKKAAGDSGSMEQHSIPDQIAADQYLAAKAAAKRKGFGIKRFKFVPPGAD